MDVDNYSYYQTHLTAGFQVIVDKMVPKIYFTAQETRHAIRTAMSTPIYSNVQ